MTEISKMVGLMLHRFDSVAGQNGVSIEGRKNTSRIVDGFENSLQRSSFSLAFQRISEYFRNA